MCLGLSISALVILRELTNAIEVNLGRHSLQFCWCFSVLCEIRRIECIASSPSFSLAQCLPCPFRSLLRTLFSARGAALPWPVHPSVIAAQISNGLASKGTALTIQRGPRFPSHFEIDDAFATAAEMGARVVRAQTIGDTVGCPLCIEPEQGKFNESAFQASDYALAVAAKHNMRLIIPLVGDCATCSFGGLGQYLAWNGKLNLQDFFTDPAIVAAYEHHIDAVLNHVNTITGVRYRDDPTIMAWENCNMCGIITLFTEAARVLSPRLPHGPKPSALISSRSIRTTFISTPPAFSAPILKSLITPAATSSRLSFIHTGTVFWVEV